MAINYNIDDYGTLKVYDGNAILFEISDCAGYTDEQVNNIIDEEMEHYDI